MSYKVILNRIEISIWEKLILWMSESEMTQETFPKIFQGLRMLPVNNLFFLLLFGGISGLGVGFVLRGITSILW